MSRLTDKAPVSINIDGYGYKIRTNFQDILVMLEAANDKDLTESERTWLPLDILYIEHPTDINQAVEKAVWFLRCGKSDSSDNKNPKICDFEIDADYIYQSLLKKGINLDEIAYMHWWTFMAHVAEISDSTYNRVLYLRSQIKKGKKLTKEEKEEIKIIGKEVIYMVSEAEKAKRKADSDYFESILESRNTRK